MSKELGHRFFQVGMVFKGLDGLLETLGGLGLLIFGPRRLNHWVISFTQQQLDNNPHQFIGNFLASHFHGLSAGGVHFAAFYLLFQGIVKLWLAEALLRERRRVFPIALVLMGLLEVYMIFRFAEKPAIGIAILFALNLIIIVLIWREYVQLRKRGPLHRLKAAA